MKRSTYKKIGILMTGLFVIPLFTLTVQATYTEIDGPIHVDISGTLPEASKTYNVYIPNNTLDGWTSSGTISSEDTISNQIVPLNLPASINNFGFFDGYYSDNLLETKITSLTEKPTSDIYLEYVGYFAKGSNDVADTQLQFNPEMKSFSVEYNFKGNSILGQKQIATKAKTDIQSYDNLPTVDGIYNITIDSSGTNEKVLADRIIYFKPSSNWAESSAKFKLNTYDGNNYKQTYIPIGEKNVGIYEYHIPAWISGVQLLRFNSDYETQWNYSSSFAINGNNYSSTNSMIQMTENAVDNWSINNGATWSPLPK